MRRSLNRPAESNNLRHLNRLIIGALWFVMDALGSDVFAQTVRSDRLKDQAVRYETYLEQLGIEYPTLRRDGKCIVGAP